ncbi:MAG: hypothetical protein LPK38_00635, partial [Actinomycetes bacterium]|nr:hypothetical protein [Actinomycetes bacterium]MDX5379820.1 hypothetical protein [Actinomycetes bacterium]MDX5398261.1 hypothetical protein [Actinomycetes bacterium]MDX5449521.1 hypothetical protein [Actinomycetes bacterium]
MRHRVGVHSHARHDEEDLRLAVVEGHHPHVHRALGAGQDHLEGIVQPVDGEEEVAGQQVPGAPGEQADRNPGVNERTRDRPHRPVPAERADDGGAVVDGLPRLARTRVLLRGLVPPRFRPVEVGAGPG